MDRQNRQTLDAADRLDAEGFPENAAAVRVALVQRLEDLGPREAYGPTESDPVDALAQLTSDSLSLLTRSLEGRRRAIRRQGVGLTPFALREDELARQMLVLVERATVRRGARMRASV